MFTSRQNNLFALLLLTFTIGIQAQACELVTEITTSKQLDVLVKSDRPAVIKLYANWCPPCRHLATYYDKIAKECPNVDFYSLNVDNKELLLKLLQLKLLTVPEKSFSIPTIIFFEKNKVLTQGAGAPEQSIFIYNVKRIFNIDQDQADNS